MNNKYKGLALYHLHLSQTEILVICPYCQIEVLPSQFEKHCTQQHALPARLCCVWCGGAETWPRGYKHLHVDHLLTCFQKGYHCKSHLIPKMTAVPSKPKPVCFDLTPLDTTRCFFDRTLEAPPPRAFDSIWPLSLPERPPLPFQDDALNRAVSCLQLFESLGDEAEWYHVLIQSFAFPHFLQALDADGGRTRTLPFSCWCDSGRNTEARYRQHRHFLIVSAPHGHFLQQVWNKIPKEGRAIALEPLTSATRLMNAMAYVSQRRSKKTYRHHFYLFETLPHDYRLVLALQFENGPLHLLDESFCEGERGEYGREFLFQHYPNIPLGLVLPVAPDFQPCTHPTDAYVHRVGGRKQYFERNPELLKLTSEAWHQRQVELGNVYYELLGAEYWILHQHFEGILREYEPLMDRNAQLEEELKRLRQKYKKLQYGEG